MMLSEQQNINMLHGLHLTTPACNCLLSSALEIWSMTTSLRNSILSLARGIRVGDARNVKYIELSASCGHKKLGGGRWGKCRR